MASAEAAEAPLCLYEVTAGPGAQELSVEATFGKGTKGPLAVDSRFAAFVEGMEVAGRPGVKQGEGFGLACAEGCRVHYRFRLADAARGGRGRRAALAGVFIVGPGGWLLRPDVPGARYRMTVHTSPGATFVTGIFPAGEATYEGELSDLEMAPYSAFGNFDRSRVEVPGGTIEVAISPGELQVSRDELLHWVENSARAVASYYRRFPMRSALVMVIAGGRGTIGYGTTMGNGGGSTMISVGTATRARDLQDDWVLTHEMVHLALPDVSPHHWLEEGIATYVEPIARARVGTLSETEAWRGLVEGLPKGLPEAGDRGLDRTKTWGRTYWGGALFCFLADLEIRERTKNKRSLDDALRGILAAGGNLSVRWDIERVLREADGAVGVGVLSQLYSRMANSASPVDLAALWRRLGVSERSGAVVFDDSAPLAAIRRSITSPGTP
jgi:hypothetical protein